MKNGEKEEVDNVVNLNNFKRKQIEEEHFTRGRTPLYMSHARGQISGFKHGSSNHNKNLSDFSDKIARIKQSMEKVSLLMADLKKLSSQK